MNDFQPKLNVYKSNRMEVLVEQLAGIVRKPLAGLLTPEIIVVQSRGMERWISMEIARINGISANCSFPFPNAFLEEIFRKLEPDRPEPPPFDPTMMSFRLMRIIPECLRRRGFEQLESYLADDASQLKLFQLAGKIADLFDQYLVFRPQMLFQWEQGKGTQDGSRRWQASLWRELVAETGERHRAWLRKELFKRISRRRLDPVNLPERVSIFGISYLPLFHLQTFGALSRLIDVNFFLVDPCREYWSDIVSEPELKKIRRKNPAVAENVEWYHFESGNRLLASMGSLGRDFFELINGFECQLMERFEEPQGGTILARIQSDVLNLRDAEPPAAHDPRRPQTADGPDEAEADRFSDPETDTSLQIHSCHSPMREVEVLHDNLLAMFEADPELMPRDILVMTPDIETYAPYVQAVFDAPGDDSMRLPFSIADRSARRENQTLNGFLALLDIPGSRLGAVQVTRLLEYSDIRDRFGLVEADLPYIEHWIEATGIRWGIDGKARLAADLPGFSDNTWRAGLDRLLLGYAMPGGNRNLFDGILPYDHIEGAETRILGRFIEFVDRLFDWAGMLTAPRRLTEWQQTLFGLIDQFLQPVESAERQLELLRRALDDFAVFETAAGFSEPVNLEVVRSQLQTRLEQNLYGSGFITGGITFCAMLPMRSIPSKVICLMGMNNESFPRDNQPLNFDLIAAFPQIADRSRRKDDKYLFLESILSARQQLYISYIGQSIQDNSTLPPSVLVNELLDTIKNYGASKQLKIDENIVRDHRLQPFSPAYFREGTGLFTYSSENLQAGLASNRKEPIRPFFSGPLPIEAQEAQNWRSLELDMLCRFFSNPAMFLVRQRLGIQLELDTYLSDERENFELAPLERYRIEQDLAENLISGLTIEDVKPILKAAGRLPHGNIGEFHWCRLGLEVQDFIKKFKAYDDSGRQAALDIDLEIGGFQLHGRITPLNDLGYVQMRYARQRASDLLRAWIHHLIFCLAPNAAGSRASYLICKGSALRFDPVNRPAPILQGLLEIYQRGLTEPVHFFPRTSLVYAEQVLQKSASEKTAVYRAQKKWRGSDYAGNPAGESRNPYMDLCFRHLDPLDEDFKQIAVQVFEPLWAHSREIG